MKTLLYVLSLLLFFLSCFPCFEDDCKEFEKDSAFSYTSGNQEESDKRPQVCTPFCIDSCCSVHVICHAVQEVSLSNVDYNATTGQYFKDTFSTFRLSAIWQPPKKS